jgi:predicted MPP superfamily phosphohydrolase
MDTQKFLPYLIVLILVAIAIETYTLLTWKKTVLKNNWNLKYYRIPFFFSILMALASFVIVYFRTNNQDLGNWGEALFMIVKLWYIPKFLLLPFMLFKDSIKLSTKGIKKIFNKKTNKEPDKIDLKKRRLVTTAGLGLVTLPYIAVADGLLRTTTNFKVEKVDIPIKNLPKEFDGFKIVQISDIHAGNFVAKDDFMRVKDICNSLNPDITVITGDFVNFHPMEIDMIEQGFQEMEAKFGVYACLGNHDHYMSDEDHLALKRKIVGYGIDLLVDTSRIIVIGGSVLNLVAIDNIGQRIKKGDFDKALNGIDDCNPTILLAHDPYTWDDEIVGKRKVDLTLSGHTHGGQIGLNFFGDIYTPAMFFNKRFSGLYQENDQYLYVNRGIATTSLPVRISIYPEITELTLRTAKEIS